MESTISIEQFREELQSWKHELSSIKEEIRYFEQHLEQLSTKRLPKDLLAEVEHFQNLFIPLTYLNRFFCYIPIMEKNV